MEKNTGYLQRSATGTPRTPQTHTAQHGARARKQERVTFHNRNIQATGEGRQHVSPRLSPAAIMAVQHQKHPSGEKSFHSPVLRIIVIKHQREHCLPRGRGRHRLQTRVSEKRMPLLSLPLRQHRGCRLAGQQTGHHPSLGPLRPPEGTGADGLQSEGRRLQQLHARAQ